MSTIPGSRRALIFEESIIEHIISSESLQYMWAACRYSILISVSEVASTIDPSFSKACFSKNTSETAAIYPKETKGIIGTTQTSRKKVRKDFGVIWNPDLRLRQAQEESRPRLDIYEGLLDSTSLVIPVASAYRLLKAGLISQHQYRLSVSLSQEIEQARSMLVSRSNNVSSTDLSDVMTEISYFCSDMQAYLENSLGSNREISSICATYIRRILISTSGILCWVKDRLPMSLNIDTGLIMHCGNYVLDPTLVLLWKMAGHKICDYTHAYAGVGHIAYTQRPELISLPRYKMLMPDITVGGLHMWKPVVSGEIMVNIDDITEWIEEKKQSVHIAPKTRIRLLFVSTGQYSKERERIDSFLALTMTLVNSEYVKQNIQMKSDIRLHPKEISIQELSSQSPIEDDLREADIIIGEFSTCLLQAEDLGKMTITVASDLHSDVYSSINTYLLSGYAKEDSRKAADRIGWYIRGRYFG